MALIFKKIFLGLGIALTLISCEAMAASTYTATVGGTSYDFTYIFSTYNENIALLQSQPWWNSQDLAKTFATAVGSQLGLPFYGEYGPLFAYSAPGAVHATMYSNPTFFYSGPAAGKANSVPYATATVHSAAAPEIDGALIPQVGLLLAGLFIILGRRKESTEPMLAA